MLYVISIINLVFTCYTLILLIRVIGSWFPSLSNYSFMHFIYHYTEPYLQIFRRLIPPIGGIIDLSPMIAFFALQMAKYLLISILVRL